MVRRRRRCSRALRDLLRYDRTDHYPNCRPGCSERSCSISADIDGDRTLDIVAGAPTATPGTRNNAGAVYAWFGGANLSGTVAPVATFVRNAAVASDAIGSAGLWCVDLDGDGHAEIIAASPQADVAGRVDAGGFGVWWYAVGTAGTITERAFAQRVAPGSTDQLGSGAVAFGDLDADGMRDLISVYDAFDHNGMADIGILYLWSGTQLRAGTSATARGFGATNKRALDRWGRSASRPLLLADTDGDGVVDVLVTAPLADANNLTDAGSLHRIPGGTAVASGPTAQEFAVPSAAAGDRLGD